MIDHGHITGKISHIVSNFGNLMTLNSLTMNVTVCGEVFY
jgi:hypothetical protein